MWLYQLSDPQWPPRLYRAEVWEGQPWRFTAKSIAGSELSLPGQRIVFFYAKKDATEPGIYGWGIILRYEPEPEPHIHFRVCPPSDRLKMRPWWDESEVMSIIDEIRHPIPQGTMWRVPTAGDRDLIGEIAQGIARWLAAEE